ncbi:hypothetical protein FB451DRAFT_1371082 [Mycena latifolia]|nr:hypothetical protein FB451DRAFT_1371082 [Mycena latifolia]
MIQATQVEFDCGVPPRPWPHPLFRVQLPPGDHEIKTGEARSSNANLRIHAYAGITRTRLHSFAGHAGRGTQYMIRARRPQSHWHKIRTRKSDPPARRPSHRPPVFRAVPSDARKLKRTRARFGWCGPEPGAPLVGYTLRHVTRRESGPGKARKSGCRRATKRLKHAFDSGIVGTGVDRAQNRTGQNGWRVLGESLHGGGSPRLRVYEDKEITPMVNQDKDFFVGRDRKLCLQCGGGTRTFPWVVQHEHEALKKASRTQLALNLEPGGDSMRSSWHGTHRHGLEPLDAGIDRAKEPWARSRNPRRDAYTANAASHPYRLGTSHPNPSKHRSGSTELSLLRFAGRLEGRRRKEGRKEGHEAQVICLCRASPWHLLVQVPRAQITGRTLSTTPTPDPSRSGSRRRCTGESRISDASIVGGEEGGCGVRKGSVHYAGRCGDNDAATYNVIHIVGEVGDGTAFGATAAMQRTMRYILGWDGMGAGDVGEAPWVALPYNAM